VLGGDFLFHSDFVFLFFKQNNLETHETIPPNIRDSSPFEEGVGVAEDLSLFHRHLALGGTLAKCEHGPVTIYTHTTGSVSFRTPRTTMLAVRARAFEARILYNAET
jgi:hypothetical protein